MQTLHDKFASQEVTQAEGFDLVRVIQEIRRIYVELGQLGDTTWYHRSWTQDTCVPQSTPRLPQRIA